MQPQTQNCSFMISFQEVSCRPVGGDPGTVPSHQSVQSESERNADVAPSVVSRVRRIHQPRRWFDDVAYAWLQDQLGPPLAYRKHSSKSHSLGGEPF